MCACIIIIIRNSFKNALFIILKNHHVGFIGIGMLYYCGHLAMVAMPTDCTLMSTRHTPFDVF